MPEIKPSEPKEIGTVPIIYTQNTLMLSVIVASGKIEEIPFEVLNGGSQLYITFPNHLKGDIPKIGIKVKDFVNAAYKAARDNKLLKNGKEE